MQKACFFNISTMNATYSSEPDLMNITMYPWTLCQNQA